VSDSLIFTPNKMKTITDWAVSKDSEEQVDQVRYKDVNQYKTMNNFGNSSQRPPFRAHSTTPFTHELDKSSEIATDQI
jgi:hypothetical protein